MPPLNINSNLGPGSTGTDVKVLQQWLVQQGYMTQDQMDTGAGTYGPKTTAAVTSWQQANGIDTQGNPGYFGPISRSFVQNNAPTSMTGSSQVGPVSPTSTTAYNPQPSSTTQSVLGTSTTAQPPTNSQLSSIDQNWINGIAQDLQVNGLSDIIPFLNRSLSALQSGRISPQAFQQAMQKYNVTPEQFSSNPDSAKILNSVGINIPTQSTTPSTSNNSSSTPQGVAYDPTWASKGITQDIWNSMSPTQQATIAVAMNAGNNLQQAGNSNVTLADAIKAAAQDPNLIAKYADAAKMDTQAFTQNLQQIQQATSTTAQQQQQQFELDRKALAEQHAAAGTAQSGFRQQAQQQLGANEQGIVTSSRSALQNQLNQATSAFEQKYGTSATTPATINFTDPYASAGTSISGLQTNSTPVNSAISGQLAGGITGTQTQAQQQDINSAAQNIVTVGQLPNPVAA